RGLHRYGANPALIQPIRHRLQFRRRASEAPHRLAFPVWWDGHIVRFISDIDASSIGMDHLQTEICALDFPHHLPSLLAVHLVPMDVRCLVRCFLCFLWWPRFHANLCLLNSTWPGPVGENCSVSLSGS